VDRPEIQETVRFRIVVRTWSRVVALFKAVVAFFVSLAALGLVADGFEALEDHLSGGEVALRVAAIAAGILGTPLAFWVGLSASRATFVSNARLEFSPTGMRVVHSQLFRKPIEIPRHLVAAAMVDERAARLRRFRDHPRFELGGEPGPGEPDHLYSRVGGAPFPVLSQVRDVPNLTIVFTEPLSLKPTRRWLKLFPASASLHPPIHGRRSRGLLLRVKDPVGVRAALDGWGVSRSLGHSDLDPVRPTEADRRKVHRLAAIDGTMMAAVSVVILVLPTLLADPLEGPVLSPGIGVCRQMAEALGRNPAPEGAGTDSPSFLESLLPDELEDQGYFLIEGGALRPSAEEGDLFGERLREAGFQQGAFARWIAPGAQILIEVVELGSEDEAADYHEVTIGETCQDASHVFEVGAIPGAVGMRWFTNIGLLDQVTFTNADLYVYVAMAMKDEEPDRVLVQDLAQTLFSRIENG
jgi:hypothetical protein